MDDLSAAIRGLLNDPQSMAQIQNLAQSLGLNDTAQPASASPAQNTDNTQNTPQTLLPAMAQTQNTQSDPMISMLMRAAPLLSAANQEDDSTRLLAALRPLLGETRQRKLDEASRILKLLHLMPLLRESGILQNIL